MEQQVVRKVVLKQVVTEIILHSGVRVFVHGMSSHLQKAIIEKSFDDFPVLDKEQYEDKAQYAVDIAEVNRQRRAFLIKSLFALQVDFPDFENRQALIEHAAPFLEKQRAFIELPEDEWEAALFFFVIGSDSDEDSVWEAATNVMGIVLKEDTETLRIFRPAVSPEKLKLLAYARRLGLNVIE